MDLSLTCVPLRNPHSGVAENDLPSTAGNWSTLMITKIWYFFHINNANISLNSDIRIIISVLRPKSDPKCQNWSAVKLKLLLLPRSTTTPICIKRPSNHLGIRWRSRIWSNYVYIKLQIHPQQLKITFHYGGPKIRNLPVAVTGRYLCRIWLQNWKARLLPIPTVYYTLYFGQNSPPLEPSKNQATMTMNRA